jgi:hypothetical protein
MSSMALRVYFVKGEPTPENVADALEAISKEIRNGAEGGYVPAPAPRGSKWRAYAIRKNK